MCELLRIFTAEIQFDSMSRLLYPSCKATSTPMHMAQIRKMCKLKRGKVCEI